MDAKMGDVRLETFLIRSEGLTNHMHFPHCVFAVNTCCNFTVWILEAFSLVVKLQWDNAGAFGCAADKHWRARC